MKKILHLGFLISAFIPVCQPANAQTLRGKWFGQTPPGNTPVVFAKGIVSSDSLEHSAAIFSPDGTRLLWTVIHRGKPAYILETRMVNGEWTKPASPSFAHLEADDFYPSFSVDGKTLFFSSRRPVPPGFRQNDIHIWKVQLNQERWLVPAMLDTVVFPGEEYAHSVAANGTIYFSFRKDGGRMFDIACAHILNGKYGNAQRLPQSINTTSYEDGPFISPDESFLIFESNRPGGIEESIDLYISFKDKNGEWKQPINMGPKVNSRGAERFGRVSPDGKYLFFGSNRDGQLFDIYWMDAAIIEELRRQP